jgi:H+/Cl- antiporter ClcA
MLLGALGGAASTAFDAVRQQAKGFFDGISSVGVSRPLHPLIASVVVALVAHFGNMPELLYKGFGNVNLVLAHAGDLQLGHLLGLLVGKIYLSGLCVTSGLVGGVFAPSIFIGASLGALYGQIMMMLVSGLGFPGAVSSASTFAGVGSAAVLASLCGVPITAVVLLLELGGGVDYNILLPLIAAVSSSVFIESILLRDLLGLQSATALQRVSSNPDREDAERLFRQIDANGDGIVTSDEWTAWFVKNNEDVKQKKLLEKNSARG